MKTTFETQERLFNDYFNTKILFDGKYRPDDNECLLISDFDDIDAVHDAVSNPLSVPAIDPSVREFETIKVIFTGYTHGKVRTALFQTFDRRIISRSRLAFYHSAKTYQRVDGDGISLDTRLSMVLRDKELLFANFHTARSIFDLSQYFIDATDSDLKAFAEGNAVKFHSVSGFVEVADSWIRKKVTLVTQSKILETVDSVTIKAAAAHFNIDIRVEVIDGVNTIMFPADRAEIKKILRFMDEDYFKSSLSGKNFVSGSKRPV